MHFQASEKSTHNINYALLLFCFSHTRLSQKRIIKSPTVVQSEPQLSSVQLLYTCS